MEGKDQEQWELPSYQRDPGGKWQDIVKQLFWQWNSWLCTLRLTQPLLLSRPLNLLCAELKSLSDYFALWKIHDNQRHNLFTTSLFSYFCYFKKKSIVHLTNAASKWSYSIMLYFIVYRVKLFNTQKSCCIKRWSFPLMHRELIQPASMIKILSTIVLQPSCWLLLWAAIVNRTKYKWRTVEKRNLWLNNAPAFSKKTELSFSVSI